MNNKFAVFILTHGRPDNIKTVQSLKKSGYTGKTYFIIDDEDETADQYKANFGAKNVIQFSKEDASKITDIGDSLQSLRGVTYARNISQKIAKDLGLDYMLQLDDDYTTFCHRYTEGNVIKSKTIRNFDLIVDTIIQFMKDSGATTIAMSQGGDHIGGIDGSIDKGILRKAMNSFMMDTNKPINFLGRINEDVNAYVVSGALGDLFFTVMNLQLTQVQTQKSKGGLTEIYLDSGTYVKSFYTVMMAPSCVSVRTMGERNRRFHHSIRWDNAVPKIVSSRYRNQSVIS